MLSAIKDAIGVIALVVIAAYSSTHQEWLWRQIASIRADALQRSKDDWGCPSIFREDACVKLSDVGADRR